MDRKNPFKWRHFEREIILLNVRWYLRYALSYRDLEESLAKPGLGFQSFHTAWRTLRGYEAMHMIRKGQVNGVGKRDIKNQINFHESEELSGLITTSLMKVGKSIEEFEKISVDQPHKIRRARGAVGRDSREGGGTTVMVPVAHGDG